MDRFPSNMYWRACNYFMAQSISTNLPGYEFLMIDGLQKLSTKNSLDLEYYDKLGFSAMPGLDDTALQYWAKFRGE